MSSTAGRKARINLRLLPAIDQLLIAGIKLGPAKKREAINTILQLAPGWTRGDCWRRIRHLRKTSELAAFPHPRSRGESGGPAVIMAVRRTHFRPWTPADDDKLLNLVGYETVKKIAQRLGRSERAVRFRVGALGMSARVSDGWSQRALRKLLRVSPARLRHLIGSGLLRVRDARITPSSLAAFCDKTGLSLEPSTTERITAALANGDDAYSCERVADLLGTTVAQVQNLICGGQLKVLDMFVTDRSFEEFCKKHGGELNLALMDPATAKWLVNEYAVTNPTTESRTVSRAQKHALVIRACHCGREIAGNAYFRHVKICPAAITSPLRNAS
jgi:hypothetical protein